MEKIIRWRSNHWVVVVVNTEENNQTIGTMIGQRLKKKRLFLLP
jgi:hypothetical protein